MELSIAKTAQKFDVVIVTALFLALAPLLTVQRTTDFMIFCIFVLAYDLIYGYMGRLSFGHMLYLGVGAYGAALSAEHLGGNPFLALIVAVAAGAMVGLFLGLIVVRTTGACFALINLAFNQVGYFLALIALAHWTGGEDGMAAFFDPVWVFDFNDRTLKFSFVLVCLLGVFFLVKRLTGSSFGILLRTIRENETRAQFLGYNTYLYKLLAFVLSAALAAFAGALTIINYTYATPSFIDPTRNVEVIFACLIGGAGNIYGALIGGIGFMIISNYLPNYIQRWEMFLGIALLVLVFRFKAGLWGYFKMLVTARTQGV
jgi:branched-chain amino acid transport system permease protein